MLLTFPFNGLFTTQNPEESVLCMSDYVTALLKTLQWIPIEFRWKAKIFIMTDRTFDDHDLLILWPHCLSLLSIFTVVFSRSLFFFPHCGSLNSWFSFKLLWNTEHAHSSEPIHFMFTVLRKFPPSIYMAYHDLFHSLVKYHFISELFLNYPIEYLTFLTFLIPLSAFSPSHLLASHIFGILRINFLNYMSFPLRI